MIDEFPGPTPQLVVSDAARAIEFYRRAFGADELTRHCLADGRVMHCELLLGGGRLLLVDDIEDDPARSPSRLGGTTSRMHLHVDDVDDAFDRFLAAGGEALAAPVDAFWGERYAMGRDPFGHLWSMATGTDELSPDQARERARRWARDRG